ncbi:hypothetical protein TrST_g7429 [Triparma strigata]|uniref:Palmitoyltransferase n=1 Tax=Triparma strigata TaxID=1606541 RepID=A0A9W7DVJ0_9STRA|nr:hypothetical protein TrST_g7429 [Triparma strigata]
MSQELSILGGTLGSLSEDPSKANDGEQKDMETVMIETPKEGDNDGQCKKKCCDNHSASHSHPSNLPTSFSPSPPSPSPSNKSNYIPVQIDSFQAIKIGHFEAFKVLCTRQSSVSTLSKPGPDGHTLMHWSSKRHDTRFIELLSNLGCDLNVKSEDKVGMTPIHWACTESCIGVVGFLIGRGVDINCQDSSGCTPLLVASQYGHATLVGYLIKKGASPLILDHNSDSALHWGAYKGDIGIVGLLHHLGLDVDAIDSYGQSPLHLASLRGNADVVEYLLLEGKSKCGNVRDKENKTPRDLAVKKKKTQVEIILRDHGYGDDGGRGTRFGGVYLRDLCSPSAWKNMLLGGGRSIEHQKWPFRFVVFHMTLAFLIYPLRIFNSDVLVDCSVLHLYSIFTMGLMWGFFFMTWGTDPGKVDKCGREDMRVLREVLGKEYDDTLESLGEETGMDGRPSSKKVPPLCHSCHISKPLRSKHCRVTRKCVLMFDHYCPFVGNCVGLYNYRYFILYILNHCLSQIGFIITCGKYLHRSGFDWYMSFSMVYVGMFLFPGLMMLQYHVQLIRMNLTTNEHSNLFRYEYLKDGQGRYRNPFDKGFMHNLYTRMVPGEEAYTIGGGGREGRGEGDQDRLLANMV